MALLEFKTIASGVMASDIMVKRSPIALLRCGTIHPGRFLILIGGSVASTEEAYTAGVQLGESEHCLNGSVFLGDVHPSLHDAVLGTRQELAGDALAVVETRSSPALLAAIDAAIKSTPVKLSEIRLGDDLGGHALALLSGDLSDVEIALEHWLGARPRVISLRPSTLGDVWRDIERVAEALGEPERGTATSQELTERLTDIAEQTLRIRPKPSVVCVEWIDPLMAAGNWMPELVTLAGAGHFFGETGAHSPWLEWESVRHADPDVIVVMPCGFDVPRTRAELAPLLAQPGWDELAAVKAGRVYLADGSQYFNRPGPRLVESLEILAEILHPDHFPPRHRGAGWERLVD